ncbi:MAG: hypothetical protein WBO70_00855 [Erysipelotrichaceae bacterium]
MIVAAIISFIIIFCGIVIGSLYSNKKKNERNKSDVSFSNDIKKKAKHYGTDYTLSNYLKQVLILVIGCVFFNLIQPNSLLTGVLIVAGTIIIPIVYLDNMKRQFNEEIFKQILIYCYNTALLLKQTCQTHESLRIVLEDIKDPLKKDILKLVKAFDIGKDATIKVMKDINIKYPYSIIKQLNLIMIQMYYESCENSSDMIDVYINDVEVLNADMIKNSTARKVLRMQYIALSALALGGYYFMLNSMKDIMGNVLDAPWYQLCYVMFITTIFASLFFANNYFNNNITKE